MRRIPEAMRALVEQGRPLVGDDRMHLRATVEPGWWLHTSSAEDAERADVMRRAVAAWRAEAGIVDGVVADSTPNALDAHVGPGAEPAHHGWANTNYVHLPAAPGNFLTAYGTANRFASAEASTPYGDGLSAVGDALVTFDPAGEPDDDGIPDTIEDAYGDDDDFDEDFDPFEEVLDPTPAGEGAMVEVPEGVVPRGRGVEPAFAEALRATVLGGGTYTASALVRMPAGVAHTVALVAYDVTGAIVADVESDPLAGTDDWERAAATATVPAEAVSAGVAVRVVDGTATTFWVRLLQVEAGGVASAWAPPAASVIATPGDHLPSCEILSSTEVGFGGATWTVHRALAGPKSAIIDRPLLRFASSYLYVDDAPTLAFAETFTVALAFRFHGTPATDQILAAKMSDDTTRGWALTLTSERRVRWSVVDDGVRADVLSAPIDPGRAVLVAGRRAESTTSVLINGVNQGTEPAAASILTTTDAPLRIGAGPGGDNADMELFGAAVFDTDLSSPDLARVRDFLLGATTLGPADVSKMPYRWWQRADNSQDEIELPGIMSLNYDHGLETDADSCTITIVNQMADPIGEDLVEGVFGDPGHFTPDRANVESAERWGITPNDWADVLAANACIRVYWGYGGHDKPIRQAVADGELLLKGVWLVDDVTPGPRDHTLTLACRDMFKLCVDQQIFPDLLPKEQYPLERCRWSYETSSTAISYEYTWPEPTHKSVEGWWKRVTDFTMAGSPEHPHGTGRGYWILGTDGKVFPFGWVEHFGDKSEGGMFSPAWGMASTPTAGGYWILAQKGHIFPFGDAAHLGEPGVPEYATPSTVQWRRIRPTKSGRGYYLLERGGTVACYGDAVWRGDQRSTRGAGPPHTPDFHTDLALTPSGEGYWMLNKQGRVYAFGDAIGPGDPVYTTANGLRFSTYVAVDLGDRYHHDSRYGEWCRALATHPTEWGFWVLTTDGVTYARGAARIKEPQEDVLREDPIMALLPSQTGLGYAHLTADGDVVTYGDAAFYGSLKRTRTHTRKFDNDTPQGYRDLTEIVRDLLLWSGFYLYGTAGEVYGNLEATGTYNEDCFRAPFFDKRPIIDIITEIRQIVGYYAWCDEEGAARFESPNFWVYGNFFPDGSRTTAIPVIDEQSNLLEWSPTNRGENLRSKIIIGSAEPTANLEGAVITRFTPPGVEALKGISRPFSFHNGLLTNPAEQELMAELVAMQYSFKQHTGTVACVPHPAIEINDQVWVYERSTGEARVHYVRGVNFSYEANGAATMTLTTNRLGSPDNWLVDVEGWKDATQIVTHLANRDFEEPETTGVKL